MFTVAGVLLIKSYQNMYVQRERYPPSIVILGRQDKSSDVFCCSANWIPKSVSINQV